MRFDSSISVDVVNNLCLTNGRGECLWREPTSEDYLYSANERIRYGGINEYDFHARSYHASLPRFDKQDPLNEKYPWLSPYAYCAGNPVMNVDRKGLVVYEVNAKISMNTGFVGFNITIPFPLSGIIAPFGGAKNQWSVSISFDTETKSFNGKLQYKIVVYDYSWEAEGGFMRVESSKERRKVEIDNNNVEESNQSHTVEEASFKLGPLEMSKDKLDFKFGAGIHMFIIGGEAETGVTVTPSPTTPPEKRKDLPPSDSEKEKESKKREGI